MWEILLPMKVTLSEKESWKGEVIFPWSPAIFGRILLQSYVVKPSLWSQAAPVWRLAVVPNVQLLLPSAGWVWSHYRHRMGWGRVMSDLGKGKVRMGKRGYKFSLWAVVSGFSAWWLGFAKDLPFSAQNVSASCPYQHWGDAFTTQ